MRQNINALAKSIWNPNEPYVLSKHIPGLIVHDSGVIPCWALMIIKLHHTIISDDFMFGKCFIWIRFIKPFRGLYRIKHA